MPTRLKPRATATSMLPAMLQSAPPPRVPTPLQISISWPGRFAGAFEREYVCFCTILATEDGLRAAGKGSDDTDHHVFPDDFQ
eukprot:769141-Rhodomonas_salina.4